MKHLMRLSYVGTHFCGFQVQPKGETVQAALQRAAEKIFSSPCTVTGCSRTDSGVHAVGQKVHFDTNATIPPKNFKSALNSVLPSDITFLSQ